MENEKKHMEKNRGILRDAILDQQALASWPVDHRYIGRPSWDKSTPQPSCGLLRNKTWLLFKLLILVWLIMQQQLTDTIRNKYFQDYLEKKAQKHSSYPWVTFSLMCPPISMLIFLHVFIRKASYSLVDVNSITKWKQWHLFPWAQINYLYTCFSMSLCQYWLMELKSFCECFSV